MGVPLASPDTAGENICPLGMQVSGNRDGQFPLQEFIFFAAFMQIAIEGIRRDK